MFVIIGTVIPAITALLGPQTQVLSVNHAEPANTYCFVVCDPGGGKSAAYSLLVKQPIQQVEKDHHNNKKIQIEGYTHAGLGGLLAQNDGYALFCSDEGSQILNNISSRSLFRCDPFHAYFLPVNISI